MLFLFRHKAAALSPFMLLLLGACAYVTPSQPAAPPLPALAKPAPFSAADAVFVQKLNTMDLAQIGMANIARTHAARNDIALVGETISKDIGALQARLAKVAAAHALTLPAQPSGPEQKQIERLQRWQGTAFDRHYIRYFTATHAKIKPVLAGQIATSKNPDLVAIARDVQTRLADYQAVMR